MKIVAVVVARMGSSRVPGKSLMVFNQKPLLEHIIDHISPSAHLDEIIVATSYLEQDKPIAELSNRKSIQCYRGDPELVLDRVYHAAKLCDADIVVEIGGDCPFLDYTEIDRAIEYFNQNRLDYLNNYEPPTYPDGYDINIITFSALQFAYDNALSPSQRIHPFSFLTLHSHLFNLGNICHEGEDLSRHHWSLDFPEDVRLIQKIFDHIGSTLPSISLINNLIVAIPELSELDYLLLRPPVLDSFWNAPSIISDFSRDLIFLANQASLTLESKDYASASSMLTELRLMSDYLLKFSKFKCE